MNLLTQKSEPHSSATFYYFHSDIVGDAHRQLLFVLDSSGAIYRVSTATPSRSTRSSEAAIPSPFLFVNNTRGAQTLTLDWLNYQLYFR